MTENIWSMRLEPLMTEAVHPEPLELLRNIVASVAFIFSPFFVSFPKNGKASAPEYTATQCCVLEWSATGQTHRNLLVYVGSPEGWP